MIEISLPFPSGIHSHNTGHWRAKAGPIKAMRQHAFLVAKQAMASHGKLNGPFRIDYLIAVPDLRRRDIVNMMQQCKPYIDGIVDSGLVSDDNWKVCHIGRVHVTHDKGVSGVTFVIRSTKETC